MTLSTGLVETGIALPPTYHCWFLVFFPLCRRHLTPRVRRGWQREQSGRWQPSPARACSAQGIP
jgi:hypothetical protein